MSNIWHKPTELCPEYDETIIVILDTGETKTVYYQADEIEDLWLDIDARLWNNFPDEVSPDHIERWCYVTDLVAAAERKDTP